LIWDYLRDACTAHLETMPQEKQDSCYGMTAARKQVEANQALINELEDMDKQATHTPEFISELEKRTVAMLNRMQQKVSAKEIISDLYEDIAENPPAPEVKEVVQETVDPIEEAKQIKNEQEMEKTVKKLKDQEALDDLKKKLGMG